MCIYLFQNLIITIYEMAIRATDCDCDCNYVEGDGDEDEDMMMMFSSHPMAIANVVHCGFVEFRIWLMRSVGWSVVLYFVYIP